MIGVSDLIDTRFPEELHPSTLLSQVYEDYGSRDLNALEAQLWSEPNVPLGDPLPIGHIVSLERPGKEKAHVLVFAHIEDVSTVATPVTLQTALTALWEHIRANRLSEIHIPVLGSGFGGAHLRRSALIASIAVSFTFASDRDRVCERIVINVPEQDYTPSDFVSAAAAFESLGYTTQRSALPRRGAPSTSRTYGAKGREKKAWTAREFVKGSTQGP